MRTVYETEQRLKRAFERRFGPSVLPLRIRWIAYATYTVFDDETGQWATYSTAGWRIRRIDENNIATA